MNLSRQRRFLLAITCVTGLWAATPAAAWGDHDRDGGNRGNRNERGFDGDGRRGGFVLPGEGRRGNRGEDEGGPRLSLDSAVGLVLSRFGGQVVKAEAQSRDGQLFYLIRVLTPDGTLVRVRVNALTGRMD